MWLFPATLDLHIWDGQNFCYPISLAPLCVGNCFLWNQSALFLCLLPTNSGSLSVGEKLKFIIDVTMAYNEEEKINFYRMFVPSRPFSVFVHIRIYPVADVPTDEEGLLKWMIGLWSEKEQRMAYFKKHQTFPVLPQDEQSGAVTSSLLRDRRRVELMDVPRFFTHMIFTTVPGAITLCVLCTLCSKLLSFVV